MELLCNSCLHLVTDENGYRVDCEKSDDLNLFELVSFWQDYLVYECGQYEKKQ